MLYEFAGTNDGELPVAQGEFVYLMDDDGSGWALMINVRWARSPHRRMAKEREKGSRKKRFSCRKSNF